MYLSIFDLDVPTLILVLVAGNLLSAVLVFAYYFGSRHGRHWHNSRNVVLAKTFQGLGFLLILMRGEIPDIISANLGNSLLFLGFYFEALAMLRLIDEGRNTLRLLVIVSIGSVAGFNIAELFHGGGPTRVIVASALTIVIFLFPCLRLLLSPGSSGFKQVVGAFYSVFLALQIPRALTAFFPPATNVLDNSPIQSLTFLATVLLMTFTLAAYLLLMKEGEDASLVILATTDSLTGLPNRSHFFEVAERLFIRYRFEGNLIGVLFLDIDHFKDVNDRHGHIFGDHVLEKLGEVIRESVRPFDVPCRYGGEEFVVLLPDVDVNGAVKVAERIRVAAGQLRFEAAPDFHLSVSIGAIARVPLDHEILDVFINQADQAMYVAKSTGRNRVACSQG